MNIEHCKFINNSRYRGHGAAIYIYCSSNNTMKASQIIFTINNCNFTNNKNIKSLVYGEKKCHKIIFNNSTFSCNQGTSVYMINQKVYLFGKILFQLKVA